MGEIINNSERNEIQQIFEDAISKIKENDQLTLSDLFVTVNPDEMTLSDVLKINILTQFSLSHLF